MTVTSSMLRMLHNPCVGTPKLSSVGSTDALDTCAGGTGWVASLSWSLNKALGDHEIEVHSKAWQDASTEPGSFTFKARSTSSTGVDITEDAGATSENTFPATEVAEHRKYKIRVVRDYTANGAGPFCHSLEPSQVDRTTFQCVE